MLLHSLQFLIMWTWLTVRSFFTTPASDAGRTSNELLESANSSSTGNANMCRNHSPKGRLEVEVPTSATDRRLPAPPEPVQLELPFDEDRPRS